MKRIGLQLGVALITFSLGVGATWVVLLISQPPMIADEPRPLNETITRPTIQTASTVPEVATIAFRRSYKNRYGVVLAEFDVTNIGNEPLRYAGVYGNANWNRYYYVRRGSELEESDRECGTGLVEHMLIPRRSVRFEVVVSDEPGTVQVGFEFFVGKDRLSRTVWSDEVYVSE